MALKIVFMNDRVGEKFRVRSQRLSRSMQTASRLTMEEAGRRIKVAGDANIRAAGNFSSRWTSSFKAEVEPQRGGIMNAVLRVFSTISYFHVHEYGALIKGKPLLWIPLPWNKNKVRARDFPGKLFRVERRGKNPLLMQKTGKTATAQYVGVKQVRLKRRFGIRGIIRRVSKQIPALYRKYVRLSERR